MKCKLPKSLYLTYALHFLFEVCVYTTERKLERIEKKIDDRRNVETRVR